MGREIRRVPRDWTHPKDRHGHYQPMHDRVFEDEAREWLDAAIAWDTGNDPHKVKLPFYWQWNGNPPNPLYHRPRWTSEPTHYQMYETVTEGTPVTPHFATKAELVDFLVTHGEEGENIPWNRGVAERFVEKEWAPSLVTNNDGQLLGPRDGGF